MNINASATAILLLGLSPACALASGYEFDGVGARAVARGGAVIADAPDWTAIYWNPANLTGVKSREAGLELKAGKSYMRDGNSFNTGVAGNTFSENKVDSSFMMGSLGAAVPLGEDAALGVGVYIPLLNGTEFSDANAANPLVKDMDFEQSASVMVGNVSFARKVSDKTSLAVGFNALRGAMESEANSTTALGVSVKEHEASGFGMEGVFGIRHEISDTLAVGAVARTGADVVLRGDAEASAILGAAAESSDFDFTLRLPPTTGIGAAWKYRPGLTFTCDLTQTWWAGFPSELTYSTPGAQLVNRTNTYDWRNSFKFRAGALWNYSEVTDFMAGYAYDTPAMDAGSLDLSAAIDVPMHRFSAAASRRWGDFEGTLAGLVGYNSRNAGGVNYRLGGWYLIGELKYKF